MEPFDPQSLYLSDEQVEELRLRNVVMGSDVAIRSLNVDDCWAQSEEGKNVTLMLRTAGVWHVFAFPPEYLLDLAVMLIGNADQALGMNGFAMRSAANVLNTRADEANPDPS